MSTPQQLTLKGISNLEEAILNVIFEATQRDKYIRQHQIERKIGVYKRWRQSNWLVATILYKLAEEGRIVPNPNGHGYKLTDAEYNLLRILNSGS